MTTGDRSQWPIERLAQFLLERAQEDAGLQCRAAANDDDMVSRLAALPAMRVEQPVTLPALPTPDTTSVSDLESLIALALESAQDAEDLSRDAQDACRRARRGMIAAIGVGMLSLAIAVASVLTGRLVETGANARLADIADQMNTVGTLQRHIDQQLASLRPATDGHLASAQAGAASATPVAAHPDVTIPPPTGAQSALPPLEAEAVRTLPATPAAAVQAESRSVGGADRPAAEHGWSYPATITAYAAGSGPVGHAPAVHRPYHAMWVHHPHRARYQPVQLPRPVALLISSVQRDVRMLFYR